MVPDEIETKIQEVVDYLLGYPTVLNPEKSVVCKLVKEDYNGIRCFTIKPEMPGCSRHLESWIRSTGSRILLFCFRNALEQVYGPKYVNNIKFEVIK
jgi:hypothetical protein